jgi:hypothetical protein
MIKIIRNIILLFFTMLIILVFAKKLFVPFAWGDQTQYTKIEYFKKNNKKYNAIYIGGSLEYRHLDPNIIDTIIQKNGIDYRSFNFGIDGHNLPQQFRDANYYLDNFGKDLDYLVMSLSSEPYTLLSNMHTKKFVCWMDFKSICDAIRVVWSLNDPINIKAKYTYVYIISWLENLFVAGMMDDVLQFYKDRATFDKRYLGFNKSGFYPYDIEYSNLISDIERDNIGLNSSRENYDKNKLKRDSMRNKDIATFKFLATNKLNANKEMTDLYNKLSAKCKKNGVELIVLMPPRGRTPYTLLQPIFDTLSCKKISLASPITYPEYYAVEYSYNYHHLNSVGAIHYSREFGRKFVEVLKGIQVPRTDFPKIDPSKQ